MDKSITEIKKELVKKRISGNDYYYIRRKIILSNKTKWIEVSVCPTKTPDKELSQRFCLAKLKLSFKILLEITDSGRKQYSTISDKEINLLRFQYTLMKNDINNYDINRYEKEVYTKYVYGTTSIEGNTYSLQETNLTLNEGLTISGKEKREFYEIENYNQLKKYIDNLNSISFDLKLVKKIHSIIMDNIDDEHKGIFRKIDVGIIGTEFEPIPHEFIEDELNKLFDWFKDNTFKIHPIELASIFHQKFEEIHPFNDGNGRVGRELLRLMLMTNNYPTIYIDNKYREEYLKSIQEGNNNNYRPICRVIFKNLIDVHKVLIKSAKEKFDIAKICEKCEMKKICEKTADRYLEKIKRRIS